VSHLKGYADLTKTAIGKKTFRVDKCSAAQNIAETCKNIGTNLTQSRSPPILSLSVNFVSLYLCHLLESPPNNKSLGHRGGYEGVARHSPIDQFKQTIDVISWSVIGGRYHPAPGRTKLNNSVTRV
jgi:hypothetical protein